MNIELTLLKETLLLWEDLNKATEFDYRIGAISKGLGITPEERKTLDDYEVIHGSEVSKNFQLSKPITNYEQFGELLTNGTAQELIQANTDDFLVSVPTSMVTDFGSKFDFTARKVPTLLLAPHYLLNWAIHKKVCIVKNRNLLEQQGRATKSSFVQQLPYDCFLLKCEEPFIFDIMDKDTAYHFELAHIIVLKQAGEVHLFGIPNEVADRSFDENEVKLVDGIIDSVKRIPLKEVLHEVTHNPTSRKSRKAVEQMRKIFKELDRVPKGMFERIYDSHLMFFHYSLDATTGENTRCSPSHFVAGWEVNESKYAAFIESILLTLDGMCSALQESRSTELVTIIENNMNPLQDSVATVVIPNSATNSLEWYEVPEHGVDFFTSYKHKGAVKVRITRGSEKSPHVRRSHPRNKYDKDRNIIGTIQVKSAVIRKDLLEKGVGSRSGTLIV
jgi:hypothetical protein